uniref:Uncharacterized protein n=1 Tax=Rangifer tarandus platyrhynchus TaxID=3082113 RepID=A0ACB0FCH6_RANTA|nr:unnamed protein product [Rangifer tarandus platyrhynchus]
MCHRSGPRRRAGVGCALGRVRKDSGLLLASAWPHHAARRSAMSPTASQGPISRAHQVGQLNVAEARAPGLG